MKKPHGVYVTKRPLLRRQEMFIEQHHITISEVVQFMSKPALHWMSRIIDREAIQDREFARLLEEARRKAKANQVEREASLIRQYEERAYLAMEDVPW